MERHIGDSNLAVRAEWRGDALALGEDGVFEIRLAGARLPEFWPLPRIWERGETQAQARAARARAEPWRAPCERALERGLAGSRLWLSGRAAAAAIPDRYGRRSLWAWADETATLPYTPHLISRGLLIADGIAEPRLCFAAEDAARTARRGLWGWGLRIFATADAEHVPRGFVLLSGRVRRVALSRSRAWLNFGEDPARDFTLALDAERVQAWQALAPQVPALEALEGQRVQVRGWMDWRGGPYIELAHVARLRALEGEAWHAQPTDDDAQGTDDAQVATDDTGAFAAP